MQNQTGFDSIFNPYENTIKGLFDNTEDIASVISYELRTPLTSIRASLGLLLTEVFGELSEKGQRLLEIALNNTERLLKLAEALEQEPGRFEAKDVAVEPKSASEHGLMQRLAALSSWRQQAVYDRLTGLPTQAFFMNQLEQVHTHLQQGSDRAIAVFVIGLDRFQVINDSLGYTVGNQLLIAIAQRFTTCLPSNVAIARLTSDKFAILLDDVQEIAAAEAMADYIQQTLSAPFILEQEVFVTASIGIAWSRVGSYQLDDWLHNADTAMHRAKALGGACYTFFEAKLRLEANSRLRLETDLHLALERGELQVYYQPIMSLKRGEISGFEALVRWQHPEDGLISPTKFIPLAEETGLIVSMGQWILREACQQLRIWQKRFPHNLPLTMGVNLAMKQLAHPHLLKQVQQILQETEIEPHTLKLEITESTIMENPENIIETLHKLKALGVHISVDDFGTGYSSLAYLYKLPIDILKIDRSFVHKMSRDYEQMEIVKTIVKLAWNLGIEVVAEGVETKQQMKQLRKFGCDFGQGYFFSQPVDTKTAEWLVGELSQVSQRVDGRSA